MNVGEICNRTVVIISRDESALEAARLMRQHNVGDVIVVNDVNGVNQPVGIVTDRDLAIEIVAQEVDPESVESGDLFLRSKLVTTSVNDNIETVLNKMKSNGVRRIPVVEDDGSLAGIITMDDMLDILIQDFASVAHLIEKQAAA